MEQQAVFLRSHLISLVILSVLVCLAPAKGYRALERGRRFSSPLNFMILTRTGRKPYYYEGYGCWCGIEQRARGVPVDPTDSCCRAQHECYSNLNCENFNPSSPFHFYNYDLFPSITCNANTNSQCYEALCLCDKAAAECLGANKDSYNINYWHWPRGDKCDGGSSNQAGDPHFVTFDGAKMTYQGDCRFLLAKPDDSFVGVLESFHITVLNTNDKQGVAFHDDVTITLANHNATMTVRGELFVDGKPRAIPFIGGPFTVTKQIYKSMFAGGPKSILNDPILHLSTPLKINVSSSVPHADGQGTHYLRIDIPAAYRGKLTGMGGNFNGDPNDDYKLSDGTDIRGITPGTFRSQMIANSWVVKLHPDNDKFPCKTN